MSYTVVTMLWEKAVTHTNVTVWQKLKLLEENIILNYIPSTQNLTTGQCKLIFCALTMAKNLIWQHWMLPYVWPHSLSRLKT